MAAPAKPRAARGNSGKRAAATTREPPAQGAPAHPAARAAEEVLRRHTVEVTLPDNLGTIRLPEPKRLVYYGGVAALAACGILEWPVALVLSVGHLLAEDHHHQVLAEFGEALAEA